MSDDVQNQILRELSPSWPPEWSLSIGDGPVEIAQSHQLYGEVIALQNGEAASIPFVRGQSTAWLTLAPTAQQLFSEIENLRSWIIPSFGWEDPESPIVVPGGSTSGLTSLILEISPSGYFRWWTAKQHQIVVLEKLKAMRTLNDHRPVHVLTTTPSLFELRSTFEISLTTGDRDGAQEVIDTIDHYELDSAVNTRFMQICLWDQFREFKTIVEYSQLSEIIQVRVPKLVRCSILNAFFETYLEHQERTSIEERCQIYESKIHPLAAGLIGASSVKDGNNIARLLAFKVRYDADAELANELLASTNDSAIKQLLSGLELEAPAPRSLTERFWAAMQKEDWNGVQELGLQLLINPPRSYGFLSSDFVRSALVTSLNSHVNDDLKKWLDNERVDEGTDEIIQDLGTVPPQSWADFVEFLRTARLKQAEAFLGLDDRPNAASFGMVETVQILDELEDILTDPVLSKRVLEYQLAIESVSVILRDLLTDSSFPRIQLVPVYKKLLDIWCENKKGSTVVPDSNIVLTLADAVLQHDAASQDLIVKRLQEWWQSRRSKSLLNFLLEVVELISDFSENQDTAKNLWLDGAGVINGDSSSVSYTERSLWHISGRRLGLDKQTIEEFLFVEDEISDPGLDPLANIKLRKIAIVSLREKPANSAADLIRARTNATVVIVSKTEAGGETANAVTADVILFVWSCATHAVYRAFDGVKDKIAYVQGTGASSIVIALERWVSNNSQT